MKKRILSALMAVTLVFTMSVAAFASLPTNITVEGPGVVTYADLTDQLSAIVPTNSSTSWAFTLDPQGLLQIPDGQTADLNTLTKGVVTFTGGHKAAINTSSVPVILNIAAEVTQATVSGASATPLVLATGIAAVTANDDNNMLIVMESSKAAVTLPVGSTLTDTDTFVSTFAGSGLGIPLDLATKNIKFYLPPSNYVVKNTGGGVFEYERSGVGYGTSLNLAGMINPDADWELYKPNKDPGYVLGVKVVFDMTVVNAGTAPDGLADGNAKFILDGTNVVAYGLLADSTNIGGDTGTLVPYTAPVLGDMVEVKDLPKAGAGGGGYAFTAAISGTRNIALTSTGKSITWPNLANTGVMRKATATSTYASYLAPSSVSGTAPFIIGAPADTWDTGWVEAKIRLVTGGETIIITLSRSTATSTTIVVDSVEVTS